jgi:hypothetical protein
MQQQVYDNKNTLTIIMVALALYISLLGPNLPQIVKKLFINTIFRIIILFMIITTSNIYPKMSIMIAIAFVLTLDYIYFNSAKQTLMVVKQHSNNASCNDDGCDGDGCTGESCDGCDGESCGLI